MYQSGQSQQVDGALPSKTPVSLLQELCMRRGISPKYDLLQIEGPVHEPTFVYRVTVGEFAANGSGQTKKKAKHAAAKAVLDIIIQGGSGSQGPSGGNQELSSQIVSPYDDGIPGNPVGALQELCMSRRWPPPTYELTGEEGFPHERTFSICCVIGSYKEIGAGKSKKLSKRQAAHKMLQKLKDQPVEQPAMNVLADDDDEVNKDESWCVPEGSQSSLTKKACAKGNFGPFLKRYCPHLSFITDNCYVVCEECYANALFKMRGVINFDQSKVISLIEKLARSLEGRGYSDETKTEKYDRSSDPKCYDNEKLEQIFDKLIHKHSEEKHQMSNREINAGSCEQISYFDSNNSSKASFFNESVNENKVIRIGETNDKDEARFDHDERVQEAKRMGQIIDERQNIEIISEFTNHYGFGRSAENLPHAS